MTDTAELPEAIEPGGLVPLDRPAAARPGRRRTALVVLPLLVGLVVAGGVGGQLLVGVADDRAASASDLTCWDGTSVAAASDCSEPRGADGLAWVFPTFDREELDCVDELIAHPEYTRPEMWTCQQAVGGRPVSVTYSQVSAVPEALRFFDKRHGRDARSRTRSTGRAAAVYTWTPSATPDGRWEASLLLRDAPFAVSVVAATRSDASRALTRRVRVRPPGGRGAP